MSYNPDYIFYVREHYEDEIEDEKEASRDDWENEHGEDIPMEEGFDHVPKYHAELNVELYGNPWGVGETIEEAVENLIDNLLRHAKYLEHFLKAKEEDKEHFNRWITEIKDRKYWESMEVIFEDIETENTWTHVIHRGSTPQ